MADDAKQEADAWNEYLTRTRQLSRRRYERVEPWAWALLQTALATLKQQQPAKLP